MGEAFITRRGGGKVELKSISITRPPAKTVYVAGEVFDPAGMVVTATIGKADIGVAGYTVTPTVMAAGTTSVTISYTFEGVSKTAAQATKVLDVNTTLSSNSWETIEEVSGMGTADSFWNVGDEKPIVLNGTTYTAQIIGFNHDNLSASDAKRGTSYNGGTNKAGITFGLKECLTTAYPMNPSNTNAGGWDASEMRKNTLATTIYGYLDTSIKSALRTVDKLASSGDGSSTILTSADKLFLFSEVEVRGNTPYSFAGEGVQYDYWKAGNSMVKGQNGPAAAWWVRSKHKSESLFFVVVGNGGGSYYCSTVSPSGVSFGFCV